MESGSLVSVVKSSRRSGHCLTLIGLFVTLSLALKIHAAVNVYITDVPDYKWVYGCMATASGNLIGYWDRNGFPDFYTGSVNGGKAPLNASGVNGNITNMWASKAGADGRPSDKPGHVDDYYN